MIYIACSTGTPRTILRIKVNRPIDRQPCLGFGSLGLGELMLELRGLSREEFAFVSVNELTAKVTLDPALANGVVVFRAEEHVRGSIADPEGYDYERLIEYVENKP